MIKKNRLGLKKALAGIGKFLCTVILSSGIVAGFIFFFIGKNEDLKQENRIIEMVSKELKNNREKIESVQKYLEKSSLGLDNEEEKLDIPIRYFEYERVGLELLINSDAVKRIKNVETLNQINQVYTNLEEIKYFFNSYTGTVQQLYFENIIKKKQRDDETFLHCYKKQTGTRKELLDRFIEVREKTDNLIKALNNE